MRRAGALASIRMIAPALPLLVRTLLLLVGVTLPLVPGIAGAQWSTDAPPPPAPSEEEAMTGQKRIEITPVIGYQFGSGFSGEQGDVEIPDAMMIGGILGLWVRPDARAEFLYTRQETSLEFRPSGGLGPTVDLGDLTIHEFQLGGTADLGPGRIRPYAIGTLGATWWDPASDISDESRLSGTLGAGIRAPLNDTFGLRVEGRWIINFFNSSGSIFCGSGGCLIDVSGDFESQGALSGGLSIRL